MKSLHIDGPLTTAEVIERLLFHSLRELGHAEPPAVAIYAAAGELAGEFEAMILAGLTPTLTIHRDEQTGVWAFGVTIRP